ncbi:MAG: TerD family protein [Verrucomicrobiota bacterium]
MNAIYLRRRRQVMLKEGNGDQPDSMLAAMQKNLEALGFVMNPALMDSVRTLDQEVLAVFYRSLVKDLEMLVGAHRVFSPMYPNFPEQVKEMPESQLYLNALIHYITLKLPVFARKDRPGLDEETELKVIGLGDREGFETIFTQLAGAKTSLSPQDKEDLVWFVSQYRDRIAKLLPAKIPSKENLAVLGAALLRYAPVAAEALSSYVKTATDVLRLAVAMSDGDVSLAESVKFIKFNRAQRRMLLSWLERTGNPVEDMLRWKKRWIRLGERLHPGDYAESFPKTFAAFKALRNDEKVVTFNSQIEQSFSTQDAGSALTLLESRPGDFARRLDHLLRSTSDIAKVLEAFRLRAERVSTPVLLQMLAHFRQRDHMPDLRIFFPKGEVGKLHAAVCKLPALAHGVSSEVATICEDTLVRRFATLPPLGRCRLDDDMKKFMVHLSQRSASKALRTITRGSRLPLPEVQVLRFFIWWRNGGSRTDIDLTAALYDHEQRHVDHLAYYNLKNFGGCHSGDITDAPQGASEFIDVELDKLRAKKVRYIVMMISSFTSQPYCDLPECFAGWMARQKAESGEIYEPRTVLDKLDVSSNTQICIPAVFDLEAREVIWADLALTRRPAWSNNALNNLSSMTLMLRSLTTLAKPDLHTLFSLHIRARGSLASAGEPADQVFSFSEGITPLDVDRIRAEFL